MKVGDITYLNGKRCKIANIFRDMAWVDFYLDGKMGNGKWVKINELLKVKQ